jgi:sugar phosphate isomerase/epimerase
MPTGSAFSRRSLLGSAALAACLPLYGKNGHALGVQLYTLREILKKQPVETLRQVSELGYREVEMLRNQIAELAPHLKETGLTPVSVHFETPLITGNWQAWKEADMPPVDENYTFEQALEETRQHGFPYIVFNYLAPKERGELDFYRSLADKLNKAGEKCRNAGLQLCYHNHDFEFQPKAGGMPIEVLLQRLDKNLIRLEVDVFWVSMAGHDASAFIRQNAGRVEMIHLKDRAAGAPLAYDIASVSNDTYREIGNGNLNFRNILRAASEAGVKHYFVEQDYSRDPIRSLQQSYQALRKLGF